MGQSSPFILRDTEVGMEGNNVPSRSHFDCGSLTPNPIPALSLMFLLSPSIPPWKPSLFWSYPDPKYTTASGSPGTKSQVLWNQAPSTEYWNDSLLSCATNGNFLLSLLYFFLPGKLLIFYFQIPDSIIKGEAKIQGRDRRREKREADT